jgi:hypothetical protein
MADVMADATRTPVNVDTLERKAETMHRFGVNVALPPDTVLRLCAVVRAAQSYHRRHPCGYCGDNMDGSPAECQLAAALRALDGDTAGEDAS